MMSKEVYGRLLSTVRGKGDKLYFLRIEVHEQLHVDSRAAVTVTPRRW
jgi:hypothetical protein